MTCRAVIFDLDGTLLDTLEDIGTAMNRVLARHGIAEHPLSDYSRFVGDGAEVLVRRALPAQLATEEMVKGCLADFREAYARCWNIRTRPYAGIPELLDALTQKSIEMAVLSNKPHEFTIRCVEAYLPGRRFAAVFGEQAGRPRKPDPAGALEIAAHLRIKPGDIYYIGDTATDMRTAAAAGMVPVGVAWGFRPVAELAESGARHIIEKPLDFIAVVA